ncbi:Metallo-beta-lactamase superfamily [Acididesulfobacillus acetoxydans]|uniref:Beta-lactamase-like n=1 Tax=Acididesulfobacillus acetoxydans TaxID=1561005 RepID=A0A8S0X677_9FIRM|nr:MBL fold metallo-hydrolase [Acididesulfobacillus acetoxydans]CAA7602290.1 Metallo-beta-lactamase superfamily [Acididesulfobacillus acetoxydans]CEJ07492.1 Beta-lactamase-like [Acididesulfobacillus acetoxydans]
MGTLEKINGHTYYCPGATNVGVVRYKNGMVLLIDAGIDSAAGRAVAQALEAEHLKAKYVLLTHAHPDHFGAVKFLKEQYTGLERYASAGEAIYLTNNLLESRALFGASPLRELEGRFHKGPVLALEGTVPEGEVEFGDKRYRIIPLPGHTYDQIGVLTGDGVLFAGDSLFSEEIMAKYGFPFLLDVEQQLQTLERLSAQEVSAVVLSHASQVYSSIQTLCAQNKARIDEYLMKIQKWCDQPLTREEVTEQIIVSAALDPDIAQYQMTFATAGAFLSYLAKAKALEKSVISGKCYYYRT